MNTSPEAQAHAKTDVTRAPTVTLLVTTGCHFCEDARGELIARADRGQVELSVVSVDSEQGRALQSTHRPSMFPLVLVDGVVKVNKSRNTPPTVGEYSGSHSRMLFWIR